jgi:hypothetical protein
VMAQRWEDLTELEQLRQSNDALHQQLMERDKREAMEKIRAESDRVRAQQVALVEAEGKERAAAMEEHRRRSWFDHEMAESLRTHDDKRFLKLMAKSVPQHMADAPSGWAPGYAPAMYMNVPAFAAEPAAEDEDTAKWLGELGVKL